MNRNIFIDNIDYEKALDIFLNSFSFSIKSEVINILDSIGRVSANNIFSKVSSPKIPLSAMDGIFLFSKITANASENNPIFLKENIDFEFINTGNPINFSYGDSVILLENISLQEDRTYKITQPAIENQNIRSIGEDFLNGSKILRKNDIIHSNNLNILISSLNLEIEVLKKPRVAIFPTGDEIYNPFQNNKINTSIPDSNSYTIAQLIKEWGGESKIFPVLNDDKELTIDVIKKNYNNFDIILILAGSSAGSKDFTKDIITSLGEVLVHGIGIKPGKPTILGKFKNIPVIGIPGYPLSAFFISELFIKPLIFKFLKKDNFLNKIEAVLSKTVTSSLKFKEFCFVYLSFINNKLTAFPLQKGASLTSHLSLADGYITIPRNVEGVNIGDTVSVNLFKTSDSFKDSFIFSGRIPPTLNQTNTNLKIHFFKSNSLNAIFSVKNKTSHIASISFLNETNGKFNDYTLNKFFKKNEFTLIKGSSIKNGFIFSKNEKIKNNFSLNLIEKNVTLLTLPKGTDERTICDYVLNSQNINLQTRTMNSYNDIFYLMKKDSNFITFGNEYSFDKNNFIFFPISEEQFDFLTLEEYLTNEVLNSLFNLYIK